MLTTLKGTSNRGGEVLAGKYQVNEIDVLVNTMKDTLVSLHSNVEVEMELGSKLREIS